MNRRLRALLLQPLFDRPRQLLIAFALLVGATALDVCGPWLTQYYIDRHLVPGDFAIAPLALLVTLYISSQCLAALGRYLQTLRFARLAIEAVRELRSRIFRHLLQQPQSRLDATPTGELISRVTSDTDALRELYVGFLASVLQNLVLLIGILVAMTLMDPRLTAIAALLIPAGIATIWAYQRLSVAAAMKVRQLRAEQSARLVDAVQGIAVIQAYRQGQRFLERFDAIGQRQYTARMRMVRIGSLLLRSAIDLLGMVVLAALLFGYGITHIDSGGDAIGIGVLYAFITYLGRVSEPLIDISQRFNLFQQASVAGTRLLDVLDWPLERLGEDKAPIEDARIELEGVRFRHDGAASDTLHGLDAMIPAGAFIGVVGATGSGKSTLLDLLCGLKRPTAGRMTIDGRPLAEIDRATLSEAVAVVPQEPFLRSTTLRDNLLLGGEASEERLEQALRDARLATLVERLPKGLDTPLGERGLSLSSGERQLLALARALLRQPRVLLLDEATASVDSATESELSKALDLLRGRVTLVVVAHRLATIREADQILVMTQGRIEERGTHAELLARPEGAYRALWRSAAQGADAIG
ncbi:ABC transporter ATP-binding protein [Halotalea alkalilenta]|uniref:ABC transporter n=1 Tax=Halotalea alkalilenta TaxID=376489 RepID=A0A172YB37_9GAMM|nr:ABC transporter transmembrane domain-containing protein [Halotalea alkalilenta]ANF56460.1 ABC transporter [Halotalea alkalilenta]